MRLVKAVLAYEGTRYQGWQVQPTGRTVQAEVQSALSRIHGRPVKVWAASRTDSGVHAQGQVIHFHSDSRLPDPTLKKALDHNLPRDVAILSLKTSEKPFHARFDARLKTYRYVIYNGRTKPVFREPFVEWIPQRLDAKKMREAARLLVGRHDFTSFASPAAAVKSKVRTLRGLSVKRTGDDIVIEARGDGFLYNMMRIIAGTLIQVGLDQRGPAEVGRILAARDRKAAGPTAGAKGLMLVKVRYGKGPGVRPHKRNQDGGLTP